MYKLRNLGGKSDTGVVNLSFLSATYYEPKASKEYSFEKYNAGYDAHSAEDKYEEEKAKRKKETLKNYHFNDDIPDEVDPIKTDTSDSKYLFDSEDAIVFNFKKPDNK